MLAATSGTDAEVLRVAQALGFLGFFCLVGAVVWGIASAVRTWPLGPAREEAVELGHLAWAVAGIALVGAHILVHTLRPVAPMTWIEAFVPFAAGGWIVAAGVAGWLALLAAAGSVLIRRRLAYPVWLGIHRAAYAGFALMAVHVVAAASDDKLASLTWVGTATFGALAAVTGLIVLRIRAARTPAPAAWGLER